MVKAFVQHHDRQQHVYTPCLILSYNALPVGAEGLVAYNKGSPDAAIGERLAQVYAVLHVHAKGYGLLADAQVFIPLYYKAVSDSGINGTFKLPKIKFPCRLTDF